MVLSRCHLAPWVADKVAIIWLFQVTQFKLSLASLGMIIDFEVVEEGMLGSSGPITC